MEHSSPSYHKEIKNQKYVYEFYFVTAITTYLFELKVRTLNISCWDTIDNYLYE